MKNIIIILVIMGLLMIGNSVISIVGLVGVNQLSQLFSQLGGTTSATWTAANLVSNGTLIVAGTSTMAVSYDGFIANANFTMATGSAKAVWTNSYGPVICGRGSIYFDATVAFTPAIVFSVGTSSSATGYSKNIVASTTIATSTDTMTMGLNVEFLVPSGYSIVAALSDVVNAADASSTYLSLWDAEFAFPCHLMGP